jgi:hypothetical protein
VTAPDLITWPPMPPRPDAADALTRDAASWPRHRARKRLRRKPRKRTLLEAT